MDREGVAMTESRPSMQPDTSEVPASSGYRDRDDDDDDIYGDDITDDEYDHEHELKEEKSEYYEDNDMGTLGSLGNYDEAESHYGGGAGYREERYGSEHSDDSDDLLPKFETEDLATAAMNTKIISTLIFIFSLFAMIFFANGIALVIVYLFALLPLSLFGLYGAFTFHHRSLGVFSTGLFLWVLIVIFTFGIVQVPGVDYLGEIARIRCNQDSQPGFRCEIERFGIPGFPEAPEAGAVDPDCGGELVKKQFKCETVVKTQLIWETWGTVSVFALLLTYCAYSVRKLYKEVKKRADAKKEEKELAMNNLDVQKIRASYLGDDLDDSNAHLLKEQKESVG